MVCKNIYDFNVSSTNCIAGKVFERHAEKIQFSVPQNICFPDAGSQILIQEKRTDEPN